MHDNMFSQIDFGPLTPFLENDDVTDISYSNGGQVWLKTLSKGIYRIEQPEINNAFMEKLAFQCSNVMGKTFNMAHPLLDAESAELRLNFVHDSVAKNGIAAVLRKTPAKIRLEKEKIIADKYITLDIHDFLMKCVEGHCNIIVCGETGSGKTEFVKYLASKIKENEKVITIEDTLELHLDRIFPHRDIVAMKTNNIASYSDVLVACMRQNPKWILLSEVRSAEAVMAVRNSISSGHYILSTIHADKASSIPNRMYSLLETNQEIDQFLKSIYRYVQVGVYVRGYQSKETQRFQREIGEVTEFYVTKDNEAVYNTIYKKTTVGGIVRNAPSDYLIDYLEGQGVSVSKSMIKVEENEKQPVVENNVAQQPVTPVVSQSSTPTIPIAPTVQQTVVPQRPVTPGVVVPTNSTIIPNPNPTVVKQPEIEIIS
ncbi:MAG: ATPase, T2SS/T4P/T4SS family [Ignavibacteriales bacterium]